MRGRDYVSLVAIAGEREIEDINEIPNLYIYIYIYV